MGELPVPSRPPPDDMVSVNKQYDLFTTFFGKDQSDLSNTIELWDAIPKYAVSARQQNSRRDANGRLKIHTQEFQYRPSQLGAPTMKCSVQIHPALIEVAPGEFLDFYPSTDEELIEEVLKKIFTDQQYGFHSVPESESWVRFSLYMIEKELKYRKKTRSIDEIKRSLEILSLSVYKVQVEPSKKFLYTNPILSDMTRVERDDYLEDTKSLWYARLPVLISKSINELTYRQFNYATFMRLAKPISRWFLKRLSHQYTNSSLIHPYRIKYSTIERDSGLLHHPRAAYNRQTVTVCTKNSLNIASLRM